MAKGRYNPSQPRDKRGRWTSGGGGKSSRAKNAGRVIGSHGKTNYAKIRQGAAGKVKLDKRGRNIMLQRPRRTRRR